MNSDIKIRWITTTCFEVVLPSGKTIIFDPWCGESSTEGPDLGVQVDFSVDQFTGADYIFLSHTHFDHVVSVKELLEKKSKDPCGGQVFLPPISAKLFSDVYDVPLVNLVPVYPYETMDLDDLIVTPLPCRHFGDKGVDVSETPSQAHANAIAQGTSEQSYQCSTWGSLEETDWAITIKENNFRFMVLGGRVYRFNNIYKFCENFHPDFVVRQVSTGATPVDYACMVARFHAPVVFPSHHDSHHLDRAQNMSFEAYFDKVNKELEAMNACTVVKNIQPYKWYHMGVFCREE